MKSSSSHDPAPNVNVSNSVLKVFTVTLFRDAPHSKIEATPHDKSQVDISTKVSCFAVSMAVTVFSTKNDTRPFEFCDRHMFQKKQTPLPGHHRCQASTASDPVEAETQIVEAEVGSTEIIYAHSHYMLAVLHANRKLTPQKNHTPSSAA